MHPILGFKGEGELVRGYHYSICIFYENIKIILNSNILSRSKIITELCLDTLLQWVPPYARWPSFSEATSALDSLVKRPIFHVIRRKKKRQIFWKVKETLSTETKQWSWPKRQHDLRLYNWEKMCVYLVPTPQNVLNQQRNMLRIDLKSIWYKKN